MPDNNRYNKKLKSFARSHRNNSTKAEVRLWCELLRNRQMMGYEFLRQRPIDNYIADFFCKDLKLIIEVDGITHDLSETIEKDRAKDTKLNELGYSVLRFTDNEVMDNIHAVSSAIEYWIERNVPS